MTTRKVLLRLGRRGRLVRVVEATNHGEPVYVVTYTAGGKRRAKFFPRPREKAEALAFAEGVAEEQTRGDKPTPAAPITLEALFAKYQVDTFPALRPRSQLLYRQFWGHFVNFAGPHVAADDRRGYVINVAAYQRGIGYGAWTHIDGWSEAVVDYIRQAESADGRETASHLQAAETEES